MIVIVIVTRRCSLTIPSPDYFNFLFRLLEGIEILGNHDFGIFCDAGNK